jgi:hypothetical protein
MKIEALQKKIISDLISAEVPTDFPVTVPVISVFNSSVTTQELVTILDFVQKSTTVLATN